MYSLRCSVLLLVLTISSCKSGDSRTIGMDSSAWGEESECVGVLAAYRECMRREASGSSAGLSLWRARCQNERQEAHSCTDGTRSEAIRRSCHDECHETGLSCDGITAAKLQSDSRTEADIEMLGIVWWMGSTCTNLAGLQLILDKCEDRSSRLVVFLVAQEACATVLSSQDLSREAAWPCEVIPSNHSFSSPSLAFSHHISSLAVDANSEDGWKWVLFLEHGMETNLDLVREWLHLTLTASSVEFIRMHRPSWDLAITDTERQDCMLSVDPSACLQSPEDLCRTLAQATLRPEPSPHSCIEMAATPASSFAVTLRWIRNAAPALARLPPLPFVLPRVWQALAPAPHSERDALYHRLLDKHFGGLLTPASAPRLHWSDVTVRGERPLRLFVYDLPPAAHAEPLAAVLSRMRHDAVGCGPGLGPSNCQENHNGRSWVAAQGHSAEVFVLAKLLRAAADQRVLTQDPREADILVVPWLCSLSVGGRNGQGLPLSAWRELLPHLEIEGLRGRHLVICSTEADFANETYTEIKMGNPRPGVDHCHWTRELLADPSLFRLDIGSRNPGDKRHLIMPHPAWDPAFQLVPGVVEAGPSRRPGVVDASRDVFLFACVGLRNGENAFGRERNRVSRMLRGLQEIGPPHTRRNGEVGLSRKIDIIVLPLPPGLEWGDVHVRMRRSVFCGCPPGENSDATPRFFISVAAGCIPVVVAFRAKGGGVSWHAEGGAAYQDTMPYADIIDYSRLVVMVPAHVRDSEGLYGFLSGFSEREVAGMQAYNAEVRGLLGYDYSGRYPDMFSAVLQQIMAVLEEEERGAPA